MMSNQRQRTTGETAPQPATFFRWGNGGDAANLVETREDAGDVVSESRDAGWDHYDWAWSCVSPSSRRSSATAFRSSEISRRIPDIAAPTNKKHMGRKERKTTDQPPISVRLTTVSQRFWQIVMSDRAAQKAAGSQGATARLRAKDIIEWSFPLNDLGG